jgi:hypothetical protein
VLVCIIKKVSFDRIDWVNEALKPCIRSYAETERNRYIQLKGEGLRGGRAST